ALISYVRAAAGYELDTVDLLVSLRGRLPAHLVPAQLIELPEIPLTANGKVDRKALPEPDWAAAEYIAPETPDERRIAELFAAVTGAEKVGLSDDFFALGGNSLSATRVIGAIRRDHAVTIGVRALFDNPTVAGFAAIVADAERDARPALEARPRPERIPLSLAQSRMWFLNRFDPESAAYNIPIVVRLSGELDVAALRAAVADVIGRHESLRTVFPEGAEGPVQVVLPVEQAAIDLPVFDVAAHEVPARLVEILGGGFDVTTSVPIRGALLRVDREEWVLAVVVHHISADGVSTTPLARDVFTAYAARRADVAPGWTPLTVQYADYTLWQREVLGEETDLTSAAARQIAYWRDRLAGAPEVIELPLDRPRPAVASYRGATITTPVDPQVIARVRYLAAEHGVSVFMLTHAVFAVLLSRLGAGDDVVIGTPIADRSHPALDDLIGMFVNTVVLRTHINPTAAFTDTLAAARDTDLDAFAHNDIPFERLVEVLAPARSQAHSPLFQVAFAYDHARPGGTLELPGLAVTGYEFDTGTSQFDLTLRLGETGARDATAALTYASDLFDASTAQSLLDRYVDLLDTLTRFPDTRITDLDLLTDAERAALVPASGGTGPDPAVLREILAAGVAANPDGVALVAGERTLSYRELDACSNRLARILIGHGAGPETFIALAFPRSIEAIVAVWAVAKTGAAFVPIDPNHPGERITHTLTDSGASLGLTLSGVRGGLPATDTTWLCLDTPEAPPSVIDAPLTCTDHPRPLRADHPAYVIYTSGSTGLPKGVVVTHTGLGSFTATGRPELGTTRDSRVLRFSSASFDASVFEMIHAFSAGATLVIADPEIYGGAELTDLLAREGVTLTLTAPAILATVDADAVPALEVAAVGGDVCPPDLVTRFGSRVRLHNCYGPTETTIITTLTEPLTDPNAITLGGLLPGARALVLDSRLRPVAPGVLGELYLAGPQLARGYHQRPDLTAGRFVADPTTPGQRLYRTGDLVRWHLGTSNPELVYVGRSDDQVQLNGIRVEPGEVDATLNTHPSVDFALTVVHRDALVSYVHAATGNTVDVAELLDHARALLPTHLVPKQIIELAEVPLTPNGKVDRKALPEPDWATAEYVAPSTPLEEMVAAVFGEITSAERVGRTDDFFALGGNSLSATRVVGSLRQRIGVTVAIRALFDNPTVAGFAAVLAGAQRDSRPALEARPRPDRIPLSLAQTRMWFLNRFDPDSATNNIPMALRLTGALDVHALQAAIGDVLARHESLRTIYPEIDGVGYQQVLAPGAVDLDLAPIPVAADEAAAMVADAITNGFDVTTSAPVRIRLLQLAENEFVLVLVVHHIAGDGVSTGPLARDVMVAYAARTRGEEPGWAPLAVQYADYTLWQREVLGD
ncbi:non-ribosomal peptide synthetase, partial [Aldersonia kunmingensis]|uniref:non-ribosomal peptide synthetase n=1 Tax=Aldersonia kunmingensis TaxID=408066 RepID=UPI000B02CD60